MQKKTKGTTGTMIVTIAKFGDDPVNVSVPVGSTVSMVLAQSGITITGRETSYVDGVEALASDVLENGDILSVVTPKQAGRN